MAVNIPIISEFDGTGVQKAIAQFKDLETNGQKAQFAIKKAAVPAALAVAGLAVALGDAAKSAMEDAAAQTILAGNLRTLAHATDAQIAATEDMITKMSLATGVADDELRPAFSKLVLATNDVERSNKLLAIAQDVAARTGKPLETVTQALAKAEMGQYAALKKLGIPMSEGIQASIDLQKEQKKLAKAEENLAFVKYNIAEGTLKGAEATKALTAANEKFATQSAIVNDLMSTTGDYADDVAKKFAGGASDAANTAEGQFKRLAVALAETKESIGAALLPAIEAVLPFLQTLGKWATEHTTVFLVIAGVVGGLALAIVAVNAAMTIWTATTKAFAVVQTAFNAILAANPVVLIGLAIAALIVGLVLLYKNFEPFRKIVDGIFGAIKYWISEVIVPEFKLLLSVAKTIFNGIASLWNNTFGKLSFSIPSWVPGLGGKGFSVPEIPMLAAGGIVTSPTLAMIGERGPEAVIPLSGPNAGGGMGGNTININVNGGDPNAVVTALRNYMRQNGSIPITTANIY
jgi:hypothetical protein